MGDPNSYPGYMANLETYRAAFLSGKTSNGITINPDGSINRPTAEARQAMWDASAERLRKSGALNPGWMQAAHAGASVPEMIQRQEEEEEPQPDGGGGSHAGGNDGPIGDSPEAEPQAEEVPVPEVSE